MNRYVICTRSTVAGKFGNEPGSIRYLRVPKGQTPTPAHEVPNVRIWLKELRKQSAWGVDARVPSRKRGDILVFVHGYNTSPKDVMSRHDQLEDDLKAIGYKGSVVSFDWPSASMALNYLEDRHDAKTTAMQLVTGGIAVLSKEQTPDCSINIHLLGHSTGAYVVREAFDDADDSRLDNSGWAVSQAVFIGGDVSAGSMSADRDSTASLYRHVTRLTNYSSKYDAVLKLSNTKRLGTAPRVGRNGLPDDAPLHAVNVDCTRYFEKLRSDPAFKAQEQVGEHGSFEHSWYIGNRTFTADLFEVLKGDLDREVIPTRITVPGGGFELTNTE